MKNKIWIYLCVKCKETFEVLNGGHRCKCPSCKSMCDVQDTFFEEVEE
jgi:hypothetical protein